MHKPLSRHARWIAFALVTVMLAACGGTPEPQSAAPAASTPAVSAAAAAASIEAVAQVSAAASAETAAAPDTAALSDEEKAAQLQAAYGPLVMLSASLAAIDDTVKRAQNGEISDIEVMGRVIGLGAVTGAANEALSAEPPMPAVEAVWPDARAAATELQGIVGRWDGRQSSPADVAGAIEPLVSRVETLLQTAERDLGAQFDIPAAELQQMRTEAIARMRDSLASPAAVPSVASQASAGAEASPAPDAAAAPGAGEPGTSRAEPLAIGTPVLFETWAVTVTEVQRGDAAHQAIMDANEFNTPPRDGFEYLLVTLQVENIGDKPEAQNAASGVGLRATGDRNVSYPIVGIVPPLPLQGELFPKGTATGQQVVEVPSGEGNLMLVLNELINFELPARFMAVDDNARVMPDPALQAIAPAAAGAGRDAPAALGETVVTDDWEVTLLETKRGAEAAALLTQANQFNAPAADGSEYVLLRVRVRRIGTDRPDAADSAGLGMLKLSGANNVVYEAPAVVAPEPRLDALLFPGGEAEGWVALSAGADEQSLVAIWQPLFSFDSSQTRYLALQ